MFDSPDYPKALKESTFEEWLEAGRESAISYNYLMVIWDSIQQDYVPLYAENRQQLEGYEPYGESVNPETLVAAYSLYSEGRVLLNEN